MSRSKREIGGYRGRRTATDVLKIIAVTLAVLVVLGIAAVVYLQRYVVYTEDGAKLELPPFLQMLRQGGEKEDPPGSASLPDPGSSSVDPDSSGDQSTPEPEPEPEPPGHAVQLSVDEVVNGAAALKLQQAGADMLVLEVKDQEGSLAWPSELTEAGRARVNGSQEAADALRQWNSGEVYTAARVCCFRDNSVPYYYNALALRQYNGNWRDELGLRWLSPAQDQAQAYIAGLCGELAALGFDEIVLEQFSFPILGRLDRITKGRSYDASQFSAEMDSFLTQVEQAVSPYGTKVSLRVSRDTLTGAETVSGLTPQLLERYAYRLWVEQDGQLLAPLDLLEQAGITGGAERLVEIRQSYSAGDAVTQAVLETTE